MALLIPVVKAFFTDYGSQVCNECLQVFGGHGYIGEWGMEQLVRDVRISQIYEGANGIHALDLVGRKLPMHGGRLVRRYLECLDEFLDGARGDEALADFVGPLAEARARLEEATEWVAKAVAENPEEVGASSYDYLRLLGLTSFAHMWAWSVQVAAPKVEGDNTGFYAAKLATARYFYRRHLPQTRSLLETLSAGADCLMDLEAEAF